jgi:hypothetical protein
MTNTYQIKPAAFYRTQFAGSPALFSACWREYRRLLSSDIDNPRCDSDVLDWLDTLAADRVNDGGSEFFIYG